MVKSLFFLFLTLSLYAKTFTVSSYNVENLFDLNYDGTEYSEYIPNTKALWNQRTFNKKFNNLVKVLKDLDSDIFALQEIENEHLIKLLKKKLPQYKYYSFYKYKNGSVGLAILSKIKIKSSKKIDVKFTNKLFRPIQEVTFSLDNGEFKIFNNHWPSKRSSESYRIKYAKYLFDRVNKLPKDLDYILVGDFNSNYNEFESIKFNEKLNDTYSITGINQVLNTTINKRFITLENISNFKKRVHYNLWLELSYPNRFSTFYKGQNNTPDSIILPPALVDNKNISYIKNSFKVFKAKYLYENKKIFRWQIKNKTHKGEGYSDHLPITASFSTDRNISYIKKEPKQIINKISQLYNIENLQNASLIENVIVIYKNKNSAILKQKNDRAIYFYNNAENLSLGSSYNLIVYKIKDFFGLKEIVDFKIAKYNGKIKDYEKLYLDGKKIDLFDLKYQNEIITNLKGFYKNGNLYFDNKKIKIYFKEKKDIPKNGSKIFIKKAQLGYYKSNIQLIIHNKSDIDVN
ncbi:MAG: endonuclease/exonuclease/phosphatase family protein [Halarcobacter sp.]